MEYWEKGEGGRSGAGMGWFLTALKEQYRHLPEIKVDEVARLVGDIRSEIPSDDAVPCRVVLLVKFLLDVRCNVLQNKSTRQIPRYDTDESYVKRISVIYLENRVIN